MPKQKKSKSFKYKLAAVLRVRNIREALQKEEVAKAQKALEEEREKERRIIEEQDQEHKHIIDIYQGLKPFDFTEIQLRKYHLEVLQERLEEQKKRTIKAEDRKKEEDKKLLKAIRDRKILDKDKEKKRLEWKKMMDKEESKFLDDISVTRYFRANNKEEQ
ncbi:MAG: flagellar FliJ family protein [Candidatus Riflemargulisbacteria bacterium]